MQSDIITIAATSGVSQNAHGGFYAQGKGPDLELNTRAVAVKGWPCAGGMKNGCILLYG